MNAIKRWLNSGRYVLLNALVVLVMLAATIGVGSASSFKHYQPQLPKGIVR